MAKKHDCNSNHSYTASYPIGESSDGKKTVFEQYAIRACSICGAEQSNTYLGVIEK